MTTYRKIYEQFHGPIPKDSEGRSYEIHHIDGDRKNNDISNLKCVSIQEHYDIHYSQGDWGACLRIAQRMDITPNQKAELSRKIQLDKVEKGTHQFLGERNPSKIRVKNGTHHFIGGEIIGQISRKRVSDGTHNFQNQEQGECPYCGKISRLGPLAMHVKACKRKMGT